LPYRALLQVDQEDSLGIDATSTPAEDGSGPDGCGAGEIEVAVARLPGISNFTDFWPLARMPGVRLRYVESGAALGRPDLVILPGTRTTARDLQWLRSAGLAERIEQLARAQDGPDVIGICGGFQMLGTRIDDPLGVESPWQSVPGLGLLDVVTRFEATKERQLVSGQVLEGGRPFSGYELHMARTERASGVAAWSTITREQDGSTQADGASTNAGRVIGTYVHGIFDSLPLCMGLIERLRARRGLPPIDHDRWRTHRAAIASRYDDLAALLRAHLDLKPVWQAVGHSTPSGLTASRTAGPACSQRPDGTP
ncbi:MAG TPA: cobyric acid synthase, partial [Isosphaeraceae bacterium]|nr:cobyric acid synthase [Isosphaeraceae bacterium]